MCSKEMVVKNNLILCIYMCRFFLSMKEPATNIVENLFLSHRLMMQYVEITFGTIF